MTNFGREIERLVEERKTILATGKRAVKALLILLAFMVSILAIVMFLVVVLPTMDKI